MKPDDLEFVRKWFQRVTGGHPDAITAQSFVIEGHEFLRLLTLLIESEAMREKAEFEKDHRCLRRLIAANDKITLDPLRGEPCIDERHYRSDEQWIAAKRKEIEGCDPD